MKWVLVAIAGAAMWITLSLLIAPGWLPKTRLGWLLLLVFGPFLFALEGLPHAVAEFWKAPASTKRVRFIRRLLLLALLAGGVIYLAFLVDRALLAGDF